MTTNKGPSAGEPRTSVPEAREEAHHDLTLFQCKLDKAKCDHEWNNEGCNPTHCVKCGQGFMAYAFMEMP